MENSRAIKTETDVTDMKKDKVENVKLYLGMVKVFGKDIVPNRRKIS